MNILEINDTVIPSPTRIQVIISDQDLNSDTDANMELHRNRVAVKRKISCEWKSLTWDEIKTILTAIKDVFFNIRYPDPETGNFETKVFYVSDRTAPVLVTKGDSIIWEGLACDFVEK